MTEALAMLPTLVAAHLRLTLLALLLGCAVSLPLGVAASRVPWLERVVLGAASVVQTIPALALLAIAVPVLARLALPSIGFLPALLGLTLYSVLPILRNTVTAIAGVDPMYVEAARGVGMTPRQQLWRVELPLAMPVIMAGIRTATIWVVGTATLATPVGAPSLGNYIFSGLQTRNYTSVTIGCVASAVLALSLDGLVRLLEVGFAERTHTLTAAAVAGIAALGVGSFIPVATAAADERSIVVGGKTFTEQYILGRIFEGTLRRATPTKITVVSSLGSTVAFDALRAGEIDVYADYSGTLWATVLHRTDVPDRKTVRDTVARFLEKQGITVVAALGFENAYALALREDRAAAASVATLTDLARVAPRLAIGGDYEFFDRPEWKALKSTYGFSFAKQLSMDPSLMYEAAANESVNVISAFSTDGRIRAFRLRVLTDDRHAIPPYDALVLASARLREQHPEALRALKTLEGRIDADRMRALNQMVDRDGMTPERAAETFLR